MSAVVLSQILDRMRVLHRAIHSEYHFALSDYWLYLRYGECPGEQSSLPPIQVIKQDTNFFQLRIGGHQFYWPSAEEWNSLAWMHEEVFVAPERNPHAYEFAGVRIRPGDCVVDAGACEGFFTRYALQREAFVLCVEPVLSLAEALRRTFDAEIAEGRVKVHPVALGATAGRVHLHVSQNHLYESRIADVGQETQAMSLDALVGEERVDFIKMDLEGAEIEGIRGSSKTIARHKPRLAIAVYHEVENARQLCGLLREIRSDYQIRQRGIYAWVGSDPRPFMVYAW